ncbi:MAG: LysR family transcriptional regulator [Phycisphaerae bacterium]|jgi:LysR family hydrogen peroxide-inducible transcriptional activator|nr:LysR family transcriptional regulator [Phycisphaerae bacterium]
MEIHQLRYFVATAEAGSVSRAALRCHVAQPSLSQQLRRLETTLGAELFDRQARGVVLTDAGRALLPRARRILAEIHDVETNLDRDVDEGRGVLTIGAIPTMAPYLMPPALGKLRQELPACELVLREDFTDSLVESLLDNQLDCAITSLPIDHELLRADELGREDLIVVVPADSTIGVDGAVSLAELRDQPLIRLEEMHCLSQQVEQFCTAKRIATQIVCRTTQLETILAFVSFGVGLSVVPEMAAASDRGTGRRYARVRGARVERAIAMTWRKDRTCPRAAIRLTEILKEQLASGRHKLHPDSTMPNGDPR